MIPLLIPKSKVVFRAKPSTSSQHHLAACLLISILGFGSDSSAQTSSANPSQAQKALITAIDLLDQVAIVQAGVGFKSIQLKESFTKLNKLWGKPKTSRKTGFLRNKRQWRYQLDSNTIIEFVGKEAISDIHIYANRLSLLRTIKGLSFASKRSEIERVYGKAKKTGTPPNSPKLSYPTLGIAFRLEKSKVNGRELVMKQIDIFLTKKK